MKRLMPSLLCCACFTGCGTIQKADEALTDTKVLIGKVSAKVEELAPKVTAAATLAQSAIDSAKEAKAAAEAKADVALNTLAERGAPVDGSAGDFLAWAAKHPVDAAKDPALFATALAALLLGHKRKKAVDALKAVVKGVEDAPSQAADAVKASIKEAGGDKVRDMIREIKRSVT